MNVTNLGDNQACVHEAHQFDVTFHAGMTVQLGANSNRHPAGEQATRPGMQHAVGVTESHWPCVIKTVGVDTGGLRCDIGAYSHHATTELIGNLEGVQVEVVRRSNEEGIEKFDQWCDDQLITPGCIQIQQLAAQVLQLPGFFRQYLLDAVRQ